MSDDRQQTQQVYTYGNPPPLGDHESGKAAGVAPPPPQDPPMRHYRPNSLGQPFNLVERFKSGRPSLGYGLFLGTPQLARIVGAAGYDWVMIDWEHTPMSIREVTELIKWVQYASEGQTAAVVRVPKLEHHWIAWCLDAGASAIILPHSETAEQAKEMVQATKFPTIGGHRSYPPAAVQFGINDGAPPGKNRFDVWNTAAVIMQVESKLGCENAESIAAVEGVDALMVGCGDLRFDLGLSGGDGPEPVFNKCLEKVINAGHKYEKPVICFTGGPGDVDRRLKQGFSGLVLGNDAMAIARAVRSTLHTGHGELQEWKQAGEKVEVWKFD